MKCAKKNTLEGIAGFINFSRMDNFIVSARKYRPETFASVVGQASITATLKASIQKKQLGHAYLFCGPRGVGKTTCARIFAKTINCMSPRADAEPCNACESCLSFNESRAFNIHELDAASNNSVDDIRQLTEQVRIPPQVGRYSIYIIDEVHMLSASAFNAFLKTLEEPPRHAVFILATTEKHKIIPTILSRCQIFDFNRIRVEDIVRYLASISEKEGVEYEADAFNLIALKADGAMRDALSIYDQMVSFSGKKIHYQDVLENLNILDYEYYFRLTESCLGGKAGEALTLFDEILSKGFDAHNFLNGFASHLRDLLVSRDEVTVQLLEVGAGIREKYLARGRVVGQEWLYDALEVLGEADVSFRTSKNQRLHVELALLKLCRLSGESKKKELNEAPAEAVVSGDAGSGPGETAPAADAGDEAETGPETDNGAPEGTWTGAETGEESEAGTDIGSDAETETGEESGAGTDSTRPDARTGIKVPGILPSIKDALNGIHRKQKPVEGEKIQETAAVLSSPFSQDDLVLHWIEYANRIKDQRPRMSNSLKNHLPVLGEAMQIELVLSNTDLLEEFNRDIKPGLVRYLEETLQNNQFRLFPVVAAEDSQQTALYTSEEKFEHMLKKNPDLGKLKERFNLDFE
jgi:DNA polymerase-3 subunit gamma/tau